jgi:hypothetical protein
MRSVAKAGKAKVRELAGYWASFIHIFPRKRSSSASYSILA